MLMGDCNYRFTNWPPYASHSNITREAAEFYECLEDNFFYSARRGTYKTRMWANAQPDGRPDEHRWRPLFNAAKFG